MSKRSAVATAVGVLAFALMAPPAHAQRAGGGWGDIAVPGYGGFGYGYDGHGIGIDSNPYAAPTRDRNNTYVPSLGNSQSVIVGPPAILQPGNSFSGNASAPAAMQSFYSGPSRSSGAAKLTVKLPPSAQLWLGTIQSGQQGPKRTFTFPSLQGSNNFSFRCTWSENGQVISREKKVDVKPGDNLTVDFTQAGEARPEPSKPASSGTPNTPSLPPTGLPK